MIYLDPTPRLGDSDNVLLAKIAQLVAAGGGGAGVSGDYVELAGDDMSGPLVITPEVNVTPLTLSGFSLTGASAVSALSIDGTWNTTGAPTLLRGYVTSTAAATGSLLLDLGLNVAGVPTTVLNLRKDGRLILNGRAAFTGTSIAHTFTYFDANTATAAVAMAINHSSTAGLGTAAANFGVTLDFGADSTTTLNTLAGRIATQWSDSAHATRTAYQTFLYYYAGTLVTGMILANGQIQGNTGTLALPSFADKQNVDLGIYFPSDSAIAFSINGVQLASFASTGLTHVNTTGPVADPATAVQEWAAAGEWQYRTSGASEGSGQTNRVHNRASMVTGAGTDYTLTGSTADVVFGTTSPSIVLPTAGTYLIFAGVQALSDGAGAADVMSFVLYNSTDASSTNLGGTKIMTVGVGSASESVSLFAVYTVTASKTITIRASNGTSARGTVIATRTNISYVRLS